MKANLANREPETLKYWDGIDLYAKMRELGPVSYTHLTLPTIQQWCSSRWSPYQ